MGEKKETVIPKSPVEQILDITFAIIEKQEEFDSKSIQELRQLALSGNLTQKQIMRAIRLSSEGTS